MYTHNHSLWMKPVRNNLTAPEKLLKSLRGYASKDWCDKCDTIKNICKCRKGRD